MMQMPSSRAVDIVGLFDESFRPLAPGARPLKALVRDEARLMDHPLEDGSTITDHSVLLPIEIELSVMLNDPANDYQQLAGLYRRRDLITVQTRTNSYANMLISAIPYEESPEIFDKVPLALRLRQVILIEAQFQALPPRQVANPRNASTKDRGEQSANPADGETTRKSSTLYRVFGLGKGGG